MPVLSFVEGGYSTTPALRVLRAGFWVELISRSILEGYCMKEIVPGGSRRS